jgi:nucleotide-binding universal stress UspA family protein
VNYQESDHRITEYRHRHPDWARPEGRPEYEEFVSTLPPHSSEAEESIKYTVLKVMGEIYVHPWFGAVCGIVFGLLLLSAVNTVIGGMMSVAYVMSRDKEVPHFFANLNMFGVPWVGLSPALGLPILLLLLFPRLETLAELYAIGVVGAIAINLSCCTINRGLGVKLWERLAIGAIAAVMIAMELTLAVQKPHALGFVLAVLGVGLGARFTTKTYLPRRARRLARAKIEAARATRAEVEEPAGLTFGTPAEELDMSKPHLMVATRGGQRLMQFAADYAKQTGAILFVIYVRHLNVQFEMGTQGPTLEEDAEAQRVFTAAEAACKSRNVPMVPIFVVSRDVADSILDFAATYDVKALLMGVSRQGTLLRALKGDVLTRVADQLPQDIPLLIHA